MTEDNDRVWIELERPARDEPDRDAIGRRRAEKATRMLDRLCDPEDGPAPVIRWNERRGLYDRIDSGWRIRTLSDHGTWLSLDYVGRPVTEAANG